MSPGHDVWTYVPEEGDAQLRGYYALESNWGALEAQVLRGTDAQIVIVDPELNEREESRTPGPGAVATLGEGYGTADADSDGELDGLPLEALKCDERGGGWRGIFMAKDNGGVHSPKWRTHTPVRMLTANQSQTRPEVVFLPDASFNSFDRFRRSFAEKALSYRPWHVEQDWSFVRAEDYSFVSGFDDLLRNPIPANKRGIQPLPRRHIVVLGEWCGALVTAHHRDPFTGEEGRTLAAVHRHANGNVDSPIRCGIVRENFAAFVDHVDGAGRDWSHVAAYTKFLTHEIVHACQPDPTAHCTEVTGSRCIMQQYAGEEVHGTWSEPHNPFHRCPLSMSSEQGHPAQMYRKVGTNTR